MISSFRIPKTQTKCYVNPFYNIQNQNISIYKRAHAVNYGQRI